MHTFEEVVKPAWNETAPTLAGLQCHRWLCDVELPGAFQAALERARREARRATVEEVPDEEAPASGAGGA